MALRRMLNGSYVSKDGIKIDTKLKEADDLDDSSAETVTARVLRELMSDMVEGINFTSETQKDFVEEWGLPTLDTSWKLLEPEEEGMTRKMSYRF